MVAFNYEIKYHKSPKLYSPDATLLFSELPLLDMFPKMRFIVEALLLLLSVGKEDDEGRSI